MRESAMVARNRQRIVRSGVDKNIDVRENSAERRRKDRNARVAFRKKRFADQRAGDAVCDGVHKRIESSLHEVFARRSTSAKWKSAKISQNFPHALRTRRFRLAAIA